MKEAEQKFEKLVNYFQQENGVTKGKMMSSAALKYNNKVFAFFHANSMTFKLGKDFDATVYGLKEWEYLNPFKNKPPMKAWIIVPPLHIDKWEALTVFALTKMKEE